MTKPTIHINGTNWPVNATIHEPEDKPCTHQHGHDFNPDNGAAYGANGNCCVHCGHYTGIEYHDEP